MKMEQQVEALGSVRLPKKGEVLGIVTKAFGAGKFGVMCTDGKERKCRVPGKIRRRVWVKINDTTIVKPWIVESDSRGDIIWRYTGIQNDWLKRNGYLKMG